MNTVVIPYRNREEHLEYFLSNSADTIIKNTGSEIIIVEQSGNMLFNRGALINVGFIESKKDYIITHDVDLNPTEKAIPLYNIDNPIVGIYTSSANTLGGIVKIRKDCYETMDGFPNNFWGWGCEDKALQNRAEFHNINIIKHIKKDTNEATEYFTIFNDVDDRVRDTSFDNRTQFEYNVFKNLPIDRKLEHIRKSGLHNIEYEVVDRCMLRENVFKITVNLW